MDTLEIQSIHLDHIYQVMQRETFSLKQASRIVGGKGRLLKLAEEGKIAYHMPGAKKWCFNAAQVLRFARAK